MKFQSLVTIIIPVFNTEKYLRQCLESVTNQTYQNLEIIVIDDGSTDGSADIAKKFASQDNRVILIHKTNGGVSSARNEGIKQASGYYISFVDADDMIHKEFVSKLLKNMKDTNADIISTKKTMTSIPESEFLNSSLAQNISINNYSSKEALIALYNGTLEKGQNGCQMFILHNLRSNNILYDTSMFIGEDFDFLARAILSSNKIIVDNRNMYFYRRNSNSAVHESFNIKQFQAINNMQKTGKSVVDKIPELKYALNNNLLVSSVSYGALMYADRKIYPKEFNEIKKNIKELKFFTLFSRDVKFNGRVKALIIVVFGIDIGLRIINRLIRL